MKIIFLIRFLVLARLFYQCRATTAEASYRTATVSKPLVSKAAISTRSRLECAILCSMSDGSAYQFRSGQCWILQDASVQATITVFLDELNWKARSGRVGGNLNLGCSAGAIEILSAVECGNDAKAAYVALCDQLTSCSNTGLTCDARVVYSCGGTVQQTTTQPITTTTQLITTTTQPITTTTQPITTTTTQEPTTTTTQPITTTTQPITTTIQPITTTTQPITTTTQPITTTTQPITTTTTQEPTTTTTQPITTTTQPITTTTTEPITTTTTPEPPFPCPNRKSTTVNQPTPEINLFQQWTFATYKCFTIRGVPRAGAARFTMSLSADCWTSIPLWFEARFNHNGDVNQVIINDNVGGMGAELRPTSFPFVAGQEFTLIIRTYDTFLRFYVDDIFHWQFPYRHLAAMFATHCFQVRNLNAGDPDLTLYEASYPF